MQMLRRYLGQGLSADLGKVVGSAAAAEAALEVRS
jgi:hypothetical protein